MLDNSEPSVYMKAIVDHDSKSWLEAMAFEIRYMDKNKVWNLNDPPYVV
jgi:hypothetical protein